MVQNLYDGIVHELLKKGTLKKKGHIVRNWKDRFFVLTASSLSYYEGQDMSVMKVCAYEHTYIHTYIHTYMRTYVHAYIHTCVQ